MVVVALISVLAGMGVVMYRNSVMRTREAVLREDLFRMRDAIDQYYADKAKYPASLESLVSDGYLRQVPVDPITNSSETWVTVPSEPDPGDPTAEPGIFDVKSGARGQRPSTARPTRSGRRAEAAQRPSGSAAAPSADRNSSASIALGTSSTGAAS